MKNFFSILPISIAILLITVFSVIPHHHHKEVLCVIMEMCEEDNTYNDQHTEHETSQEDSSHDDGGCVVDVSYTAPSQVMKGGSTSVDGGDQYSLIQCFCLIASYSLYTPDFSIIKTAYSCYVVSYESAFLGRSSGLRAPPVYLS